MSTTETVESKLANRGRALALADVQIEGYRSRESLRVIRQTVVDWALLLAVPGLVVGVSAGWDVLWPVAICGGSGAILGALYGLRLNGIRASGEEQMDFRWDAERKKDELTKMLRDGQELEEVLSRG